MKSTLSPSKILSALVLSICLSGCGDHFFIGILATSLAVQSTKNMANDMNNMFAGLGNGLACAFSGAFGPNEYIRVQFDQEYVQDVILPAARKSINAENFYEQLAYEDQEKILQKIEQAHKSYKGKFSELQPLEHYTRMLGLFAKQWATKAAQKQCLYFDYALERFNKDGKLESRSTLLAVYTKDPSACEYEDKFKGQFCRNSFSVIEVKKPEE